jgi:hypothetical protein
VHVQLAQDVLDMGADSVWRKLQALGDSVAVSAEGELLQDLELSRSQGSISC